MTKVNIPTEQKASPASTVSFTPYQTISSTSVRDGVIEFLFSSCSWQLQLFEYLLPAILYTAIYSLFLTHGSQQPSQPPVPTIGIRGAR